MSGTIKVTNIHISLFILMIVADMFTVEYSNVNLFFSFYDFNGVYLLGPGILHLLWARSCGNMRLSLRPSVHLSREPCGQVSCKMHIVLF